MGTTLLKLDSVHHAAIRLCTSAFRTFTTGTLRVESRALWLRRVQLSLQYLARFRSAREAEESESRARAKGEVLPSEERFDSNCITPGTEFMDRLDKHLQYFVTSKVSTDSSWQSCTVIYSGHQTPGEGEHKIMEYIRFHRSQPGYDPDTRHCLYGLDADLLMLGLTSHDPHFALLREEVKFGGRKEASKRTTTAEETTFHLLHLSLLREYINYEFEEISDKLPFKYDLECIIDDWVFMGFLVGNDFIPHLPTLHINKDALPLLFNTYKNVMPDLDGYLNEGGVLNLGRFEKFMAKLADYDRENFSDLNADLQYFNSKRSGSCKDIRLKDKLQNFYDDGELDGEDDMSGLFDGLSGVSLHDKKNETTFETLRRLGIQNPLFLSDDEEDEDDDEEEELDNIAEEFRQHKRNYYMEKMGYEDHEKFADICHEQAINYVRGLQWILHYYYNGIQSWSWYYPFHYAPYISDIKNFANSPVEFEMGKPFMPFEQLLAVLPPLSVKLLPKCYANLMLSQDSPVIDFYPRTFETDLNGKQQDWEAVVLIPFIDEKRLLEAMSSESHRLTADEKRRTAHGPMYVYTYTPDNLGSYQSPEYFPNVSINHAKLDLVFRDEWDIHKEKIRKGLCPGARTDLYFSGFPTLRHLQHTYRLEKASVKVFQQASRNDSIVLELQDRFACPQPSRQWFKDVATSLSSNKMVFVGWPHLKEAQVVGVSNSEYRVSVQTNADGVTLLGQIEEVSENEQKRSSYGSFGATARALNFHLLNRWGIDAGNTSLLVHCKPMTGKRYVMNTSGGLSLSYDWSEHTQAYLAQTVVQDIAVYDPGHPETCSLDQHFLVGTKVFMLGQPHYGACGTVLESLPDNKTSPKTRIRVQIESRREPNLALLKTTLQHDCKYMDAYALAQRLGVSQQLVVRITGSVLMVPNRDPSKPSPAPDDFKSKVNIGLNLRINKKMEEVRGYSHRTEDVWTYSEATLELLLSYHRKFPHVIEIVSKTRNDVMQQELFPGPDGDEQCRALVEWLKESEGNRNVRQTWGTELLSDESVAKLKYEIDNSTKLQLSQPVKMQVKPHLLFKPNPLQGSTPVDGPVKTELWDRIINVRDGYMVPLAARGTVIGIQPAAERADVLYDILFDEAFPGGLSLAGPASAKCCYRLCASAFINLSAKTRPQPLSGSAITVVLNGRDSRSKDRALKIGKLCLEARPPELAVDELILVLRLVEEASAEKAWFGQGHEDFQYTGQEILREARQVEVLGRVGRKCSAFCLSSLDPPPLLSRGAVHVTGLFVSASGVILNYKNLLT
ncbi:putative 5-3 exonuclease [Trinorchestia longiramus]|nr:putative 5-3 exonuclease [Trinorchestia longiramus]